MFGIFFTPVFYDAKAFGQWEGLMLLNPLGSLLEQINRVAVLHQSPEPIWTTYAIVSSVIIFMAGMTLFRNIEPLFAENI